MHHCTSHGYLQRQREKAANDEDGKIDTGEVLPTLLRPVSTITRKTGCGNYFSFESFGTEIKRKPTEAAGSTVYSSSSSHIETIRQLKQRNGCQVVSDQENNNIIKSNTSSTCTGQRSSSQVGGKKISSSVESSRPAESLKNADIRPDDRKFPKSCMKHKSNIDQSKRRVQFPPEGHEVTEVFEVEVEKLGTRRAGKCHGSDEMMDLTEELQHEAGQLQQVLLDVLEDEHKQSPILKKLHSRALGEQRGEAKREVKKAEEQAEARMQRGLKTTSLKGGAAASSPFRMQQASVKQAYVRSSSQSGPTAKPSAPRLKRPQVRPAAVRNLTSRLSNKDDLPIAWPEPRRNSWLPEGTRVKLAQPTAHEASIGRWKRIAKVQDELRM
eukprot:gnl/MRDRNA2_/MRDRNA2_62327_c0_seq1.p1 gnl/MRDRNA2_/MRDRNA2_62327_c0~~gnl/MRDRNA2_/MRDRNA2_62327_c0_seq1.p1  ORF type:complete len:383 (-),score=69.71 gnl/MRDRNA2_/MRDRNA2_62327_c0_seq1:150-1298(-)